VFNLKHKGKVAKALIDLDKAIETKFKKWLHTLCMDNGGEFLNHKLQSHCHNQGISISTSVTYNPELNGHAEWHNRTLVEGARKMLQDSELGKDLWAEAILTHICNLCPSSILPNHIMPYEKKVFGHAPSVNYFHIFGSKCFIKVPDETRSKLDDKAKECWLISFEGNLIYIVMDMDRKRLRT